MNQPPPPKENWLVSGELPPKFAVFEGLLQPVVAQMQASIVRILKDQFKQISDSKALSGASKSELRANWRATKLLTKMFKNSRFAAILSTSLTEGLVRVEFELGALIAIMQIIMCLHITRDSVAHPQSTATKSAANRSPSRVRA